jgi:hypothetical protein
MRCARLVCLAAIALVILVTPHACLADSFDYQGAGTLKTGTAFTSGMIASGHTWDIGDRLLTIENLTTGTTRSGKLGIVDVQTGTLFSCSSGLCFNGGTLDIDALSGNDVFVGNLLSGTVSSSNGIAILSARLANGATTVIRERGGQFSSQALVHTAVVPEPASWFLMGSGLLLFLFQRGRKSRFQSGM